MNPRFNLARWLLVVTLGCSLGLLLVFAVVSARIFAPGPDAPFGIAAPPESEPLFEVSNDLTDGELRNVVASQLDAFRKNDYTAAYKYASASLKEQMPLPVFERMVKSGYGLLAHSRSAQFGVILDNGGQAVVNISVTGLSGRVRHYRYLLLREDGSWRIFGVKEMPSMGRAV